MHGCFWHQHSDPACRIARRPRSNQHYWLPKLERNVARDAEHQVQLSELGWDVLVIWECDLGKDRRITDRIQDFWRLGKKMARKLPVEVTAAFPHSVLDTALYSTRHAVPALPRLALLLGLGGISRPAEHARGRMPQRLRCGKA